MAISLYISPATSSARSATGCVAHGLGFLPTSHTRDDDETRRIDGSVHDNDSGQVAHAHASSYQAVQSGTGQMPCILWMVR